MVTDKSMKTGDLLVDGDGHYGIVLEHICETFWYVKWSDLNHTITLDSGEVKNGNWIKNLGQAR